LPDDLRRSVDLSSQYLRLNKIEIGQFLNMKYKLIPENKERYIANKDAKPSLPFGKNSSATIKAIPKPDIPASENEYGICFLLMTTPSLFANVSFLIKDVLEKCRTNNGIQIIVAHINIVPRLYLACCSFETLIVTAIPKLIPNQNTKFHSLSLFSHLACTLGKFSATTSGFVKSCITRSYNWFKPYTNIVPKIEMIAKQFIAVGGIIGLFLCNNSAYGEVSSNKAVSRYEIIELIKVQEVKHHIPSGLLLAVIKTESNLNPFALNISGKPLYFTYKDEAIKAINEAVSSGVVNIDIGISQINYKWHGEHFTSIDAMLSLDANISYAAKHLSNLKLKHGNWHKALRHYHSANPMHHKAYSRKVVMCWLGTRPM
jgi:hypothetical protein